MLPKSRYLRRCKIDFLITESIICHIYQTAFRKEEEKEAESKSETEEESQCEAEEADCEAQEAIEEEKKAVRRKSVACIPSPTWMGVMLDKFFIFNLTFFADIWVSGINFLKYGGNKKSHVFTLKKRTFTITR